MKRGIQRLARPPELLFTALERFVDKVGIPDLHVKNFSKKTPPPARKNLSHVSWSKYGFYTRLSGMFHRPDCMVNSPVAFIFHFVCGIPFCITWLITDKSPPQVEAYPQVLGKTKIKLERLRTSPPQYFIRPHNITKPLKILLRCRAEVDTGKSKPELEWSLENSTLKTGGQYTLRKRRCFVGLKRSSCEHSLVIRSSGSLAITGGTYTCSAKSLNGTEKAAFVLKNGGMSAWCGKEWMFIAVMQNH